MHGFRKWLDRGLRPATSDQRVVIFPHHEFDLMALGDQRLQLIKDDLERALRDRVRKLGRENPDRKRRHAS